MARIRSEYERKKRNERMNAKYAKRKRNQQCIFCEKTDERTLAGKTLCSICAERHSIANKKRYIKRSAERLEKGICIRCGKNPHQPDKKLCQECVTKLNGYPLKRKKEK